MPEGVDPQASPAAPHIAAVRDQLIEFHIRPDLIDAVPHPYPASRAVPEWFRQMPLDATEPGFNTVKRCPPFLEAMTAGYIIPVPTDITVTVLPDQVKFEVAGFDTPMVEVHMPYQFPGAPFGSSPALKFLSPWIVKTPPGYSTLFVAPLNRVGSPFVPLSGIVETDTLYQEIHFPSLCLLPVNRSASLKRGDPLVQAIPFRRENWTSADRTWDEQLFQAGRQSARGRPHHYKEDHWKKKTFT